jgi:hypothetical protein
MPRVVKKKVLLLPNIKPVQKVNLKPGIKRPGKNTAGIICVIES